MRRSTEAEKKRRQRERAKRGGRILQTVEIMDWDAWGEILREGGWLLGSVVNDRLVRDATRNFIWKLCKDYQREKADRQLAEFRVPVTGAIDRETGPYLEWRVLKPKDLQRTVEIDPETYARMVAADDDVADPVVDAAMIKEGGFQIKDG